MIFKLFVSKSVGLVGQYYDFHTCCIKISWFSWTVQWFHSDCTVCIYIYTLVCSSLDRPAHSLWCYTNSCLIMNTLRLASPEPEIQVLFVYGKVIIFFLNSFIKNALDWIWWTPGDLQRDTRNPNSTGGVKKPSPEPSSSSSIIL